ncbi:MAG: hypothetical protein WCV62_01220 [Candidatus Peribacteraceae bacterium]|jgi:hypothetical protein
MAFNEKLLRVVNLLLEEEEMADGKELVAISYERFNHDADMTEDEAKKLLKILHKHGCIENDKAAWGDYMAEIIPARLPPYSTVVRFLPGKLLEERACLLRAEQGMAHPEKKSSGSRFHFHGGVLHMDGIDTVLKFREREKQYSLLAAAFALPLHTRIDGGTEGIDLRDRQLYDAARLINEKVRNKFGYQGVLFRCNYADRYVERIV